MAEKTMNQPLATKKVRADRPRVLSLVRKNLCRKDASAESIGRGSSTFSAESSGNEEILIDGGHDILSDSGTGGDGFDVVADDRARVSVKNNRLFILEALMKINAAARKQLNQLSTATDVSYAHRKRFTAELRSIMAQVNVRLFEVMDMPTGSSFTAMYASLYALEAQFDDVRKRVADISLPSSAARPRNCREAVTAALCDWFSNFITCFQFRW
uniref:Uncharacterized protein n=1 Tax=Sipha flava TaxID=143950 RepID=A0A2S2Q806_9HEMI